MNKQEYLLYIENLYDTFVNIQEDRNISYGELYHLQTLKKKELKELEQELTDELKRIAEIVKDFI